MDRLTSEVKQESLWTTTFPDDNVWFGGEVKSRGNMNKISGK